MFRKIKCFPFCFQKISYFDFRRQRKAPRIARSSSFISLVEFLRVQFLGCLLEFLFSRVFAIFIRWTNSCAGNSPNSFTSINEINSTASTSPRAFCPLYFDLLCGFSSTLQSRLGQTARARERRHAQPACIIRVHKTSRQDGNFFQAGLQSTRRRTRRLFRAEFFYFLSLVR